MTGASPHMSTADWHLSDASKVRLDKSGFSWGYFSLQPDIVVDRSVVHELQAACLEHDQASIRLCLHADPQSSFHEMVIAERRCSYYPPHQHRQREESIQVLEGRLAAVLFENDGRIREIHLLEASGRFLLRLAKGTYHFYLPLTECAVYYETKLGPYDEEDNVFASWAPLRADRPGAETFKQRVRALVVARDAE